MQPQNQWELPGNTGTKKKEVAINLMGGEELLQRMSASLKQSKDFNQNARDYLDNKVKNNLIKTSVKAATSHEAFT